MRIITPSKVFTLDPLKKSVNVVSLCAETYGWRSSDNNVNFQNKTGLEQKRRYEGALESEITAANTKMEELKEAFMNSVKELVRLRKQAFDVSPILTYEELAAEIATPGGDK